MEVLDEPLKNTHIKYITIEERKVEIHGIVQTCSIKKIMQQFSQRKITRF
jgi:hypothetical protein